MQTQKPDPVVFVVDDDEAVRDSLKMLLSAAGLRVETYPSAGSFLKGYVPSHSGCLILDIRMPGMSGLALQDEMHKRRISLPILFLTGHADVPIAVRALKQGAFDFIEKPLDSQRLVLAVMNALRADAQQRVPAIVPVSDAASADRIDTLSDREKEVLKYVLEGKPTREIAVALNVSVKTIEFHRARIREKLGVNSLAELFKMFMPR
jgi:two-component system, LuxR family, response regulator FixJ